MIVAAPAVLHRPRVDADVVVEERDGPLQALEKMHEVGVYRGRQEKLYVRHGGPLLQHARRLINREPVGHRVAVCVQPGHGRVAAADLIPARATLRGMVPERRPRATEDQRLPLSTPGLDHPFTDRRIPGDKCREVRADGILEDDVLSGGERGGGIWRPDPQRLTHAAAPRARKNAEIQRQLNERLPGGSSPFEYG